MASRSSNNQNTLIPLVKTLQRSVNNLQKQMVTKDDARNFATKADLKDFATKADLSQMATKTDLASLATKKDLKQTERHLRKDMRAIDQRLANLATSTPTRSEFEDLKTKVNRYHPTT